MLRRVALVLTDVSEELSASFIRVTRIGELGTTLAVTSNRRSLRKNTGSSETSVLTRTIRPKIPGDAIRHSHRRENLKSYILLLFVLGMEWIKSTVTAAFYWRILPATDN
jgi:hypothetical protein